jgi:hypothetical protein
VPATGHIKVVHVLSQAANFIEGVDAGHALADETLPVFFSDGHWAFSFAGFRLRKAME